jgi:hypothetical protein
VHPLTANGVTFYLPKLVDAAQYDRIDPDTDWTCFRNARAQWIPHTYVRLRRAGHDVRISDRPPERGIAVVFAGDMRRFLSARPARANLRIVCAQADRRVPETALADVIVQHNGLRADGTRRVFVPNWPQNGLVPRAPRRGTTSWCGRQRDSQPRRRRLPRPSPQGRPRTRCRPWLRSRRSR